MKSDEVLDGLRYGAGRLMSKAFSTAFYRAYPCVVASQNAVETNEVAT